MTPSRSKSQRREHSTHSRTKLSAVKNRNTRTKHRPRFSFRAVVHSFLFFALQTKVGLAMSFFFFGFFFHMCFCQTTPTAEIMDDAPPPFLEDVPEYAEPPPFVWVSTADTEIQPFAYVETPLDEKNADSSPRILKAPQAYEHCKNVKMVVTAYCPCKKCCDWMHDWRGMPVFKSGPNRGKTKKLGYCANGKKAKIGTIAADPRYPFGTIMEVPGYPVGIVSDRGGAITGNRLDLFFPSHSTAQKWGRRTLNVKVWKDLKSWKLDHPDYE